MTRTHWLLAGLVAVEVGVGGYLAAGRLGRHTPPPIDPQFIDPIAAEDIRGSAADCRTPGQWLKLGEIYLAVGYYPEAEACFREAAALDPTDADLAYRHGFALERLGLADEANGRYERAVELGHTRPADCWYNVGRNNLRLGRDGPARDAFGRAGNLPAARFEAAILLARADQAADAGAEAWRLADEFPSATQPISLLYRLARLGSEGPAADALADQFFKRTKRLPSPFVTDAERVQEDAKRIGKNRGIQDGFRLNQERRGVAAEMALRAALAADWHPQIADQLAVSVFMLGRPSEAADLLAEAVARGGPEPFILWRLGEAYATQGQMAKAREVWERSARLMTGHRGQGLWDDMASLAERDGEPGRAKAFRARALLAAGVEQLNEGRPGPATQLLTEAVGLDPGLAAGWYYLGEIARAHRQPADAAAGYRKCLAINPDHGRAIRALKLLDTSHQRRK